MTSNMELMYCKRIRDTAGLGAQLKLIKRKFDNLRYIKSQSGIQNDEG